MCALKRQILLGGEMIEDKGKCGIVRSFNPATGQEYLIEEFSQSSLATFDHMLAVAQEATDELRRLPQRVIFDFLSALREAITTRSTEFVAVMVAETGFTQEVVTFEMMTRVVNQQIPAFQKALQEGGWMEILHDAPAHLLRRRIPLAGPVLVLGPRNFPAAFNGTGSCAALGALITGHAVICIGNRSQPRTAAVYMAATLDALKAVPQMPRGAVQFMFGLGITDLEAAVNRSALCCTDFTGSNEIGNRLMKRAPDKFHFEGTGMNVQFVLSAAIASGMDGLAKTIVEKGILGGRSGQLCTADNVVIVVGDRGRQFRSQLEENLSLGVTKHFLLSQDIREKFVSRCSRLTDDLFGFEMVGGGIVAGNDFGAYAALLHASADDVIPRLDSLSKDWPIFGPAALVIEAVDEEEALIVARSLTHPRIVSSVNCDAGDYPLATKLTGILAAGSGRVVLHGVGPGVAISNAMCHKVPFAGSNTTGVGSAICRRFTTEISLQGFDSEHGSEILEGLYGAPFAVPS